MATGGRETLCWTCARGAAECCWMKKCRPVAGWTAQRTRVRNRDDAGEARYISSYRVTACPNYVAQEARVEMRQCPVCRKMFEARAANAKYCSRICGELARMKILQRPQEGPAVPQTVRLTDF